MPASADGGIKNIVNGPITFTPDANPLIGPAFDFDQCLGLNWFFDGCDGGRRIR